MVRSPSEQRVTESPGVVQASRLLRRIAERVGEPQQGRAYRRAARRQREQCGGVIVYVGRGEPGVFS